MQQNLTRKWRPKIFSEVVGQQLTIRLLKNSLYRNEIFPVYLFSGLRGSGKTTTARLFAAAINCEKLAQFQDSPRSVVLPCLSCPSCKAMSQGNHPDFIEVDAASHTGVDNVRMIIEAASFLPVLGKKKIYLIDESHMLSKAAFNAFLKILEEPPKTALFLLATTDPQKIIETVKSRSFQLFFDPILPNDLLPYLEGICQQEAIEYEIDALKIIAQEGGGSARDSVNILERVRLSTARITVDAVYKALAIFHDKQIIKLFDIIAEGSLQNLLHYLSEIQAERYSPGMFWTKLVSFVRALVWGYHGLSTAAYSASQDEINRLAHAFSFSELSTFLELLYRAEAHFLKTTAQYPLIESLLCKMTQQRVNVSNNSNSSSSSSRRSVPSSSKSSRSVEGSSDSSAQGSTSTLDDQLKENTKVVSHAQSTASVSCSNEWSSFLSYVEKISNPLLLTIFQQGVYLGFVDDKVALQFDSKLGFYEEWLQHNERSWLPVLHKVFGDRAQLSMEFVGQSLRDKKPPKKEGGQQEVKFHTGGQNSGSSVLQSTNHTRSTTSHKKKYITNKKQEIIDISDTDRWKMANMLVKVFPGTVRRVKE